MKKKLIVLLTLLCLTIITGLSGCNFSKGYTYVIGQDVTTQDLDLSYLNTGDVYGYGRSSTTASFSVSTNLYLFKLYDDGRAIPAEGSWIVEPSTNASFSKSDVVHENFITIIDAGVGKIKVYVPSDNDYIDKKFVVYPTLMACAYPDDIHPNTFDFDKDGTSDLLISKDLFQAKAIVATDECDLWDLTSIPSTGYSASISNWQDKSWNSYVLETSAGQFVKFRTGAMLYNYVEDKIKWLEIHYYLEPNSTTTFQY